ncbi:MAG TPA: hypothetical protein DEH02_20715 [Bacteroidales bacterium]|nr:MAG: hypothetical protein A2X01_08005 [Bacteroidetes bacterium GWF2_35_48]HBX53490.1 hypothetical protein [Bacteroidales bacterium]
MKKYIILLIILIHIYPIISTSNNLNSLTMSYGWDTVYIFSNNSGLVVIDFLSANVGYVSRGRHLIKTTNSGNDWNLFNYANTTIANIISLSFINDSTGFCTTYAYGNPFRCYKTIDGGLNWNELHISDTINTINKVYFVDSLNGYVIYSGYYVFKTNDGGNTWALDNNLTYNYSFKVDIKFVDNNVGYITNYKSVYKTIDAGLTWSATTIDTNGYKLLSVVDQNTVYIGGEYGTLFKTTNGGITWSNISFEYTYVPNLDIVSICAINKDIVYVSIDPYLSSNSPKILKTTDGGLSWDVVYISDYSSPTNLFFLNENLGFCYVSKYILRYTGSSGIEQNNSEKINVSISPNPTSDKLYVEFNTEINNPFQIQLIEIASGKVILQETGNTQNFRINMEKLPSSVYILRIFNEKFVFNNRIIKQ